MAYDSTIKQQFPNAFETWWQAGGWRNMLAWMIATGQVQVERQEHWSIVVDRMESAQQEAWAFLRAYPPTG